MEFLLSFQSDIHTLETPTGPQEKPVLAFLINGKLAGRIIGPGKCGHYIVQTLMPSGYVTEEGLWPSLTDAVKSIAEGYEKAIKSFQRRLEDHVNRN